MCSSLHPNSNTSPNSHNAPPPPLPQDLCAIDLVPQLITAGVKSFKIEGRLKGPEYVAITTKAYRLAVDDAWNNLLLTTTSQSQPQPPPSSSELKPQSQSQPQTSKTKPKPSVTATTTTTAIPLSLVSSTASVPSSSPSPLDVQLQRDLRQVFARGQDADHDGLSR